MLIPLHNIAHEGVPDSLEIINQFLNPNAVAMQIIPTEIMRDRNRL
jgi:hypothetical protein